MCEIFDCACDKFTQNAVLTQFDCFFGSVVKKKSSTESYEKHVAFSQLNEHTRNLQKKQRKKLFFLKNAVELDFPIRGEAPKLLDPTITLM